MKTRTMRRAGALIEPDRQRVQQRAKALVNGFGGRGMITGSLWPSTPLRRRTISSIHTNGK